MKLAPLPTLAPADDWEAAPYRVLTHGCDTYAETWNAAVLPWARKAIEEARAAAEEADLRRRDPAPLVLAGQQWQVLPHGAKGGVVHILARPEVMIMFRAFSTEWCITVRYLSAGIWEHGVPVLRQDARDFLESITEVADTAPNPRVTRFDYAIDLHAPEFKPGYGMADDWVFPQGTAKMRVVGKLEVIGRKLSPQTFTLGKITGLQVQLYDKVAEIREASGKDWFKDIWGGIDRNVWRIEARFSGGWLKERGIRTYEDVDAARCELIAGALSAYRLSAGDSSRARRAKVHPMWWKAYLAASAASFIPRKVNLSTMRREEFRALMVRNVAGSIRAAVVAHEGEVTAELIAALTSEAVATERDDRHRGKKTARLQERHRWIGEAAS